jgi:transposase
MSAKMAGCNRTNHTTTSESGKAYSKPSAPHAASRPAPLSRAEIAARSASAAKPAECRRWHVLGLLADGVPLADIEAATGCRPRTIRQIAQRYRELGPAGLADGRQHSPGAAPILSAEQQEELRQVLLHPAPDGGAWNGPKVAQWIAARMGKRVHRQRGWEYLRRLGGGAHASQLAPPGHEDDADAPA